MNNNKNNLYFDIKNSEVLTRDNEHLKKRLADIEDRYRKEKGQIYRSTKGNHMKKQGKLLSSLQRVQPNKQYVDSRNKLQDALQQGTASLFTDNNPNQKTMSDDWKDYLKEIKKDNQKILNEILNLRKENDRY